MKLAEREEDLTQALTELETAKEDARNARAAADAMELALVHAGESVDAVHGACAGRETIDVSVGITATLSTVSCGPKPHLSQAFCFLADPFLPRSLPVLLACPQASRRMYQRKIPAPSRRPR